MESYIERIYYEKLRKLLRSMQIYFKSDCGCSMQNQWALDLFLNGDKLRWIPVQVGLRSRWRYDNLPYVNGLVCKMSYGEPTNINLNIVGGTPSIVNGVTIYEGPLTINGFPLTFLHIRNFVHIKYGARYANIRLFFQIDCSEEKEVYRLVYKLRRNNKYYFSWLPKEVLRYIQTFL